MMYHGRQSPSAASVHSAPAAGGGGGGGAAAAAAAAGGGGGGGGVLYRGQHQAALAHMEHKPHFQHRGGAGGSGAAVQVSPSNQHLRRVSKIVDQLVQERDSADALRQRALISSAVGVGGEGERVQEMQMLVSELFERWRMSTQAAVESIDEMREKLHEKEEMIRLLRERVHDKRETIHAVEEVNHVLRKYVSSLQREARAVEAARMREREASTMPGQGNIEGPGDDATFEGKDEEYQDLIVDVMRMHGRYMGSPKHPPPPAHGTGGSGMISSGNSVVSTVTVQTQPHPQQQQQRSRRRGRGRGQQQQRGGGSDSETDPNRSRSAPPGAGGPYMYPPAQPNNSPAQPQQQQQPLQLQPMPTQQEINQMQQQMQAQMQQHVYYPPAAPMQQQQQQQQQHHQQQYPQQYPQQYAPYHQQQPQTAPQHQQQQQPLQHGYVGPQNGGMAYANGGASSHGGSSRSTPPQTPPTSAHAGAPGTPGSNLSLQEQLYHRMQEQTQQRSQQPPLHVRLQQQLAEQQKQQENLQAQLHHQQVQQQQQQHQQQAVPPDDASVPSISSTGRRSRMGGDRSVVSHQHSVGSGGAGTPTLSASVRHLAQMAAVDPIVTQRWQAISDISREGQNGKVRVATMVLHRFHAFITDHKISDEDLVRAMNTRGAEAVAISDVEKGCDALRFSIETAELLALARITAVDQNVSTASRSTQVSFPLLLRLFRSTPPMPKMMQVLSGGDSGGRPVSAGAVMNADILPSGGENGHGTAALETQGNPNANGAAAGGNGTGAAGAGSAGNGTGRPASASDALDSATAGGYASDSSRNTTNSRRSGSGRKRSPEMSRFEREEREKQWNTKHALDSKPFFGNVFSDQRGASDGRSGSAGSKGPSRPGSVNATGEQSAAEMAQQGGTTDSPPKPQLPMPDNKALAVLASLHRYASEHGSTVENLVHLWVARFPNRLMRPRELQEAIRMACGGTSQWSVAEVKFLGDYLQSLRTDGLLSIDELGDAVTQFGDGAELPRTKVATVSQIVGSEPDATRASSAGDAMDPANTVPRP